MIDQTKDGKYHSFNYSAIDILNMQLSIKDTTFGCRID